MRQVTIVSDFEPRHYVSRLWNKENRKKSKFSIVELKKVPDNVAPFVWEGLLMISGGMIVSALRGNYRVVGTYEFEKPHNFKIGDEVQVDVKDGKIVSVKKVGV